eukprot:414101_1
MTSSNTASDDELTRLNNSHNEQDRKIVIAGLIIENTFTSITDMVFVIIEEFLKSRQQQNNNQNDSNANNNDVEIDDVDINESNKMGRAMKYFRLFLKYFITNNWDSLTKVNEIILP